MNAKEYIATQLKLVTLGKEVSDLDLKNFLSTMMITEAAGPMFDPTLYRKAIDNMLAIKELALAFTLVQDAYEKLMGTVIQTTAKGYMEGPPR